MSSDRYIAIDEEGYFHFNGQRIEDEKDGRPLLENITPFEGDRVTTTVQGQPVWVEAFDAPFIARHVRLMDAQRGILDLPYGSTAEFEFSTLSVDQWDRFHGVTTGGVPFVFSRQAQVEFFDVLDEFDDESVTIKGVRYPVGPWLIPISDINRDQFWTDIYKTEEQPGWDLQRENPILPEVLPQLKLNKLRVLVLGCGAGHDAAYFARAGHVVTGVDFSSEALRRAGELYGGIENLNFVQSDVFGLPEAWSGKFDLVFEHTCYCAISPERRDELVAIWRRVLHPQGHLLGIFFAMEKRTGPPFGGSEWEIRERLKRHFKFLYWTRWRRSLDRRKARELVIYARRT